MSPITKVFSASTIEEAGLPLKSMETSGSSDTWSIPFNLPEAAFLSSELTASFVVSFSVCTTTSTIETVGVGTRMARPSSLPFSSGITSPTAFAAPVVVGIILIAAALARRKSLWGRSSILWSFVYEWIVVMRPFLTPKASFMTLTTGAMQFVVHDAFDNILSLAASYVSSFTPKTTVLISPLAGADIITFLAPAERCRDVFSLSLNMPVDSITYSTPSLPQGNFEGSFSESTFIFLPSTMRLSPSALTSFGKMPKFESYLRR